MSAGERSVSVRRAAIVLGVMAGMLAIAVGLALRMPKEEVRDFDDCKAARGVIMESYPEQCRIRGATYINEAQQAKDPTFGNDYIGMMEDEALGFAEQQDVPARVVEREGEALPVTMDFVLGRHNLYIRDGAVYRVEIEGQAVDN